VLTRFKNKRREVTGTTQKAANRNLLRPIALASAIFVGPVGLPCTVAAQEYKDIQVDKEPLVLKARGSFIVGGDKANDTLVQLGNFGIPGHIAVNQMYVEYMAPKKESGWPVAMIHGMALTGKSYDTTPDGRMGWYEYFVRKGRAVYIPDQVGRGRSGFNQAIYNDVKYGNVTPASQPAMNRFSDELNWTNFRFGTGVNMPFKDLQFPISSIDELSKQNVPDLSGNVPSPNPTFAALADLAVQVNGAVLLGHSQGGAFPLQAALVNTKGIKGMVLVEPGGCPTYTDAQIATLATIPILVVYGDHIDQTSFVVGFSWKAAFEGCKAFVQKVKAAGGKAEFLHLPRIGIYGNSHMMMFDKNNLQIADLILAWIDRNVPKY
jgi:pimeloyl-ACP methyl ester carboxylesterase